MAICVLFAGEGTIKVKIKPEAFKYKGQVLTLELTIYSCDVCGEAFFDNENEKATEDHKRFSAQGRWPSHLRRRDLGVST